MNNTHHRNILYVGILIAFFYSLGGTAQEGPVININEKLNEQACAVAQENISEGDIIFTDIPSLPFRKIAETTKSWTSHVGLIFLNDHQQWVVAESKVPLSQVTLLCDFIKRSDRSRFEIRRFERPLDQSEIFKMKQASKQMMGKWYGLNFNFNSKKLFCSKFVYLVYQSIGVSVGQTQTFSELLNENPAAPLAFWRLWFFGFIPWKQITVSPASQLRDGEFRTVSQFGLNSLTVNAKE